MTYLPNLFFFDFVFRFFQSPIVLLSTFYGQQHRRSSFEGEALQKRAWFDESSRTFDLCRQQREKSEAAKKTKAVLLRNKRRVFSQSKSF